MLAPDVSFVCLMKFKKKKLKLEIRQKTKNISKVVICIEKTYFNNIYLSLVTYNKSMQCELQPITILLFCSIGFQLLQTNIGRGFINK